MQYIYRTGQYTVIQCLSAYIIVSKSIKFAISTLSFSAEKIIWTMACKILEILVFNTCAHVDGLLHPSTVIHLIFAAK